MRSIPQTNSSAPLVVYCLFLLNLLMSVSFGVADDGEAEADTAAESTVTLSFAKDIQPVLMQHCISCHGPDKQRGRLRLDGADWLGKGGKNGVVVVAGKPQESELYHRISLPPGDDDLMPPEDKGERLDDTTIALIHRWIEEGAAEGEPAEAEVVSVPIIEEEPLPPPADPAALEPLQRHGVLAVPIALDRTWLMVDFSRVAESTKDEHLALLVPLREQLRWLNLARCEISDAGLRHVGKCTRLTRLHLQNTSIGDPGIVHLGGLDDLTYLNLYGTEVTDAVFPVLRKHEKLRNLYLWKSKVTRDAILDVRGQRPDLVLSYGARYETEQRQIWELARQFHRALLRDTPAGSLDYHSKLREFQTALRDVQRSDSAKQESGQEAGKK